jgi:hypothetical protein
MKLAIMQPYLFPYIGYFQLMNAVDKFVVYDDVTFIKKGWINRNNILVNGRSHRFTIPLKNASQNVLIKDLELSITEKWKNGFFNTIKHSYSKAPFFNNTISIIENVINTDSNFILDWHLKSFELIKTYLNIGTKIVKTSSIYNNQELKGQYRIMDICLKERTKFYLNPIGGKELYESGLFHKNGIILNFINSESIRYSQFGNQFIPSLSIIDVMMFNSVEAIKEMLKLYKVSE